MGMAKQTSDKEEIWLIHSDWIAPIISFWKLS